MHITGKDFYAVFSLSGLIFCFILSLVSAQVPQIKKNVKECFSVRNFYLI